MSTKTTTVKKTSGSPKLSKKATNASSKKDGVTRKKSRQESTESEEPPSPVESDTKLPPESGKANHDILNNLATDTARNIVNQLQLPEKLSYMSRYSSGPSK